jgi:hypothetical protein
MFVRSILMCAGEIDYGPLEGYMHMVLAVVSMGTLAKKSSIAILDCLIY